MQAFVEAGPALPGPQLSALEDQEQWEREVVPLLKLYSPFGNFSELNFAQVGHGIGQYRGRRRFRLLTVPSPARPSRVERATHSVTSPRLRGEVGGVCCTSTVRRHRADLACQPRPPFPQSIEARATEGENDDPLEI
jgi:hypothetical protein